MFFLNNFWIYFKFSHGEQLYNANEIPKKGRNVYVFIIQISNELQKVKRITFKED